MSLPEWVGEHTEYAARYVSPEGLVTVGNVSHNRADPERLVRDWKERGDWKVTVVERTVTYSEWREVR
jgi:hypothetical protein